MGFFLSFSGIPLFGLQGIPVHSAPQAFVSAEYPVPLGALCLVWIGMVFWLELSPGVWYTAPIPQIIHFRLTPWARVPQGGV